MANHLISLLQAFQLVALVPCIFVIFFLLVTSRNLKLSVIPILYFTALCCSFVLPLLVLFDINQLDNINIALLFGESLIPALCYLLILQFMYGKIPGAWYWLILCLPIIGGGPIIYSSIHLQEFCVMDEYCLESSSLKRLYNIFSAAMTFLLLLAHYSQSSTMAFKNDPLRSNKFWLIMAFIMLSLQIMVVDLAALAGMVKEGNAVLVSTLIRVTFIFLVLTSIFKIFGRSFELAEERIPTLMSAGRKPIDLDPLINRLEKSMREERLYREMSIARESLAARLSMPEHQLSRIINNHFKMNFNEYINHYRVEEAKMRLKTEKTAVTTIAFEVGFNSIASFNRVFKEMTSISPTEYRSAAE